MVVILTTDDFATSQAAREHLSQWYDEQVWTQQPHADIALTWQVENPNGDCDSIGGDYYPAVTIECEARCTYYEDYTATATVRCRFERETEELELEEATIRLEAV